MNARAPGIVGLRPLTLVMALFATGPNIAAACDWQLKAWWNHNAPIFNSEVILIDGALENPAAQDRADLCGSLKLVLDRWRSIQPQVEYISRVCAGQPLQGGGTISADAYYDLLARTQRYQQAQSRLCEK